MYSKKARYTAKGICFRTNIEQCIYYVLKDAIAAKASVPYDQCKTPNDRIECSVFFTGRNPLCLFALSSAKGMYLQHTKTIQPLMSFSTSP